MEPEASGMEGIYYFPVEYDVPRVDGELHEKLEQRVSSLLQTTTELFISGTHFGHMCSFVQLFF